MENNITATSEFVLSDVTFLQSYVHFINLILSLTGVMFNLFLIIVLIIIRRNRCTTYFLLIIMSASDFLYCIVYLSILLTVDQYINIINHQILCPLSFFLTPFTFTGSTLLLFICFLHLITNYVRKYDTVVGQIGGRLSVVFVLAFIIIRSVLSSTSIELITLDPTRPHIQYCTIDMNTPPLVMTVQNVNHIFAEVTDLLVYIGWILLLILYFLSYLPYKKLPYKKCCFLNKTEIELAPIDRPYIFTSLIIFPNNTINNTNNTNIIENNLAVSIYPIDVLNITNESTILSNKVRHRCVSFIIISITFLSIILYLPIMILKYSAMYSAYHQHSLLTSGQNHFLQIIQHSAHLFCLTIRCFPYIIFDKRIHSFFSQMIGMKCMKIERRRTRSKNRKYHFGQKYIFHCHCYRRQKLFEF